MYKKIIIILKYLIKLKHIYIKNYKLRIFHKKKLELGKIQFLVDDIYFYNIKIYSSFRQVMINQPSSEADRTILKNQLDKFSFNINYFIIFIFFFIFITFNIFRSDNLYLLTLNNEILKCLFSIVFDDSSEEFLNIDIMLELNKVCKILSIF